MRANLAWRRAPFGRGGDALRGRALRRAAAAPIASDSALLFANTLIGAALGVVFWTVAARRYNLAAVGFSSALVSAATLIATFANLGLSAVVIRYLPVAGERGRRLCVVASLVPAIVAGGAALALSALPAGRSLTAELAAHGLAGALAPAALAVAMAVGFVQDSVFIARRRPGLVLARGAGSAVVRLALLPPFAGFGAFGLAATFVVGAVASAGLGTPAWARQRGARAGSPAPARELVAYAGTNYVSGLFSQAPPLLYPILIAGQVSREAAGAFAFAWMATALLLALPPAVANVLLAQLVGDPGASGHRIRTVTRATLGVVALFACLTLIAVSLFARLALPGAAADVQAYLPLLLGSVVPFAAVRLRSMDLAFHGRLRGLLALNGTVAIAAVLLPVALLPRFGVVGLEAGWLASLLIGTVVGRIVPRCGSREVPGV